jgi:hypothetical protein
MNSTLPDSIPQRSFRTRLSAHDGVASDDIAVSKQITDLVSSVLRNAHSDKILDAVEVVGGYAEVWMKYQEVFSFRQRMADALVELANLMESAGDHAGAKQARWCALYVCSRDLESGRVIQPTDLNFRI